MIPTRDECAVEARLMPGETQGGRGALANARRNHTAAQAQTQPQEQGGTIGASNMGPRHIAGGSGSPDHIARLDKKPSREYMGQGWNAPSRLPHLLGPGPSSRKHTKENQMHGSVPRASGKPKRAACIGRRMERAVSTRPRSTRAMGVSKHAMDTGGRQETRRGCDKHPAQENPEILPHFGGSCIKRWARMVTAAASFSFSVFLMRHLPGILLKCKSPATGSSLKSTRDNLHTAPKLPCK